MYFKLHDLALSVESGKVFWCRKIIGATVLCQHNRGLWGVGGDGQDKAAVWTYSPPPFLSIKCWLSLSDAGL